MKSQRRSTHSLCKFCKWMTQSWDDMLVFQNTSCAQWSVNTGFAIPSHRSYSVKSKHNVGVFRMNVAVMCRWQGAVDHGRLSAWQTSSWLTAVCVFFLQPTRSSSESICSRPGSSIPGSPGHTIYVRHVMESLLVSLVQISLFLTVASCSELSAK